MLCTTEAVKVPDTIVIRCYHTALRPLKPDEIGDLVEAVASLEGWTVTSDVLSAVIEASTGQPRKALSILQAVHDAPNRAEVGRIINLMSSGEPLYDLCRALIDRKPWSVVCPLLEKIEDAEFEGASIMLGRFFASAMVKAKDDKKAEASWRLLDALLFPAETYDKKAAFMAAVGRIMWGSN
jgi:DNA polymerase III gamma/tau subunit